MILGLLRREPDTTLVATGPLTNIASAIMKDISTMNTEDFIEKISNAAKDVAGQIEKNIFQNYKKIYEDKPSIW